MKALILILLTIFGLSLGSQSALAVETPNFPSCNNPSGTIIAQYTDGIHGIVGDSSEHSGSDAVYQLDNNNLMQCFCTVDGNGIQTNWWKDGSISSEDRQILINSGWNYVPNGALWGLAEDPYYAKNANYNCGGTGGGNNDTSNGTGGGEITPVAASTSNVLGLAFTGNIVWLFGAALATSVFLLLGIFFYKKANH